MNERLGNYAELRFDGKRRLIEVTSESDGRIKGYRVNRDGSRWDRDDGQTWAQEIVIASSSSVTRRLTLDLTYGELVEA
jgi:hypothetical protein